MCCVALYGGKGIGLKFYAGSYTNAVNVFVISDMNHPSKFFDYLHLTDIRSNNLS